MCKRRSKKVEERGSPAIDAVRTVAVSPFTSRGGIHPFERVDALDGEIGTERVRRASAVKLSDCGSARAAGPLMHRASRQARDPPEQAPPSISALDPLGPDSLLSITHVTRRYQV